MIPKTEARVLHLSTADSGGGAFDAAYRIHKSLRDASFDSHMCVAVKKRNDSTVVRTRRSAFVLRALATLEHRGMNLFFGTQNPYLHSAGCFSCRPDAMVRDFRPDIVQLTWVNGGFMSPEDVGRITVPVIWRLADMWPFCGAEHFTTDSDRYITGYLPTNRDKRERGVDLNRWVWQRKCRAYSKADLTIVAPSRWIATQARKSFLFAQRRIEIIPTGIDDSIFWPEPMHLAREKLGIAIDAFVLVAASGSFRDPRKGVQDLRDLFRKLSYANRLNQLHVITVGRNDSEVFSNIGLPMTHLGYVRDSNLLRRAYSAAQLNLCTSTHDNLPNTILESHACGCPTAAYDVGGVNDAVIDGVTGFLLPPGDLDALCRCVSRVIAEPGIVVSFRENCRRYHLQAFTLEAQVSGFRRLYSDLLDGQRVPEYLDGAVGA